MRIWMIATLALWDKVQREQTVWVDPSLINGEFYGAAYPWMMQQMAKRLPDYHGHFPWWAWACWYPHSIRPDLRDRMLHAGDWVFGTQLVRLELDIAPAHLLLSDFDLWHFVLNQGYLSWNEAEDDIFQARWDSTPPLQRDIAELELRWERIFDLEYPHADPEWLGTMKARRIQAVFEELRAGDVRHVTHFRARPTRSFYTPEHGTQ